MLHSIRAVFMILLVQPSFAQEKGNWSDIFGGSNGIDGQVYAIAIDSVGNVYVGGIFSSVGGVAANNIAMWTGHEWRALGLGVDRVVYEIEINDDGLVFVGGEFTMADLDYCEWHCCLGWNRLARDGKWHC